MMKQHSVRPDSTTAYHLVRTSMLLGRRSLAEAYVREFESNGIRCADFFFLQVGLGSRLGNL